MVRALLVASLIVLAHGATYAPAHAEPSKLWGASGELWTPESRLPDFSFAGYPVHITRNPEQFFDITEFGAKPNDDVDDTEGFRKAIAYQQQLPPSGSLHELVIPEGRYIISDIIEIRRSLLLLRGAGPDKTILTFTKDLEDVWPNMGATTTGDPTSNYSWSGGFIWVKGRDEGRQLATVAAAAARGATTIEVDKADNIKPRDSIRIALRDDAEASLVNYLYAGDPGPTTKLRGDRRNTSFVSQVAAVDGKRVTLDRPLPFEIRLAWKPVVRAYAPSVTNVGIDSIGFEFRNRPYPGHFKERGANAIALDGVAYCWVNNVRIHNADSGIFLGGNFCTVDGVIVTSERQRDKDRNSTGHHGIEVGGDDNVICNFDFRTRFIHDLTVSHCHGNVFCDGRGEDLSLDHHKYAPYANLFTNLDAGAGTQLWVCGGGADLGQHSAAWETFWNIRAKKNLAWPPKGFAPDLINVVGLTTSKSTDAKPEGRWWEAIKPQELEPQNLWEAQRTKRLKVAASVPTPRQSGDAPISAQGVVTSTHDLNKKDDRPHEIQHVVARTAALP